MKITYDKEANAAYIYLKKFTKVFKTMPINDDLMIDLDSEGKMLGIEILNATSHMTLKDMEGIDLQTLPV